ncbi:Oidioi.mRNA.OKI2018_I69.chr1.g397.t1.cds [Oikopleura dioica]|uniref:Oidioi.mRNA.OKI2018_I69.chr1.g397.t1.cds n=1 Tax=Oikopleura dioica TaxID=34765 RepID=A0ABN7SRX8_OIKDI|nr:Oidioi.mRNA.OKI2018_I69.chr1.g397.t1.cds [Oikopleura dioica]
MKEEENCTNERSGQEKDVSLIDTDQELVDDGQLLGQGQVSIDIDVPLLDTNERQRNEEEQNDDQEVNTPSTEENSKKCCSKEFFFLNRAQESRRCFPFSCQACHADMTFFEWDISSTTLTARIPWVSRNNLVDGFVPVNKRVKNARCMDSVEVNAKLGSPCLCDEDQGCAFDNWPENICARNGYGEEYFWTPGPQKTFTEDRDFTSTIVEDDYSLTYLGTNGESDVRFSDRISWWENGPSICRARTELYMPGVERPVLKDDGSLSTPAWNQLECDFEINKYPTTNDPISSTSSSHGSDSYEASELNEEYERLIIVGNYNQGFMYEEGQEYGLCRWSKENCIKRSGASCHSDGSLSAVENEQTRDFIRNAPYHPGVLSWRRGNLVCNSLVGVQGITNNVYSVRNEIFPDNDELEILVRSVDITPK